jgi:ABC-type polysaccharide/polyol phosphate transport system ATPase subunit
MNSSITAERVGVHFLFDRHRRVMSPTLAGVRGDTTEVWGLHDVRFSIGAGEGVALLGPSGAGKTTLLRTIASIYRPDTGRLTVEGRVGAVLSTEAGLMLSLTGRENASLLGVLAGLSRAEAKDRLRLVKEESGLGDAFERPVSAFSQGMQARLGFASAVQVEPEVLLLDEVHEALDHEYRDVVERRANEIIASGGIVVATGHDHDLLARFCGRALLLTGGTVVADGPFDETQATYLDDV